MRPRTDPTADSGAGVPSPAVPRSLIGRLTIPARAELEAPAPEAARLLLGCLLVRRRAGAPRILARIVETEAYREDDPASHSYAGRTRRTEPMFGPAGTAYVYRSYGIHWCCNVTVEAADVGAAVLVRAAVVVEGEDQVRARRPHASTPRLLRGPGNLAAGLDIDGPRHGGADLLSADGELGLLRDGWRPDPPVVAQGPRVGVTRAAQIDWRFSISGEPAVSSYRRSPRAGMAEGGTERDTERSRSGTSRS